MNFAFGSTVRPRRGERVSGDATVTRVEGDRVLFAVIDALGHGPPAAETADIAVAHLQSISLEGSVLSIVHGLHEALRKSRGAAAMICRLEGDRLAGCGVGNVEIRATGASLSSVLSPGVLGGHVRKFQTFAAEVVAGTRLVLFTDGISQHFTLGDFRAFDPSLASQSIVTAHGRDHDDAAVLVADLEA